MKAKINQAEVEYEEFGAGPAVLFLHDYPTNQDLPGDEFADLARAGYRVILTNLQLHRGVAESAADAVALLNFLGIGRAIVFGISLGGCVLLDLLEKFPGRVAASSLVLTPAAAKAFRRQVKRPAVRSALQAGRLDELKKALRKALPGRQQLAPPDMPQLGAWIRRVRCRNLQAVEHASSCELLADMEVPPLLIESQTGRDSSRGARRQKASLASRSWKRIKGLNAHLVALLDSLIPRDEEQDEEEILSDLA